MKFRIQVDLLFTDVVRFPGETATDTRVYDIEADNIHEAHSKAREFTDKLKENPYCTVKVTRQRLLGVMCEHCLGKGVL